MYKSCNIILHGLCFFAGELVSCCYAPNDQINGGKPPILFDNYNGEIIPKDKLFARMHEFSSQFKNGSCPKECENCFKIEEKDWDESEYIDYITITHFSPCNADCIYCSNNLELDERKTNTYEIMPFLRYLKNEGIIKQGCELHIGGGEFSIYKECDDILSEFGINKFANIYIPTNAIKYSAIMHKALSQGSAYIVVSLDSGTRKTFKKIKRVDAFDKVVENICKYATEGTNEHKITLKYVIIPGVNDNIQEFQKFLDVGKKAKVVQYIRIDIEARYLRSVNNIINPYYLKLAKKMKEIAISQGFKPEFHSFIQQSMAQNINYKDKIRNLINFIELKYLKKAEKEFYTNHKY